VRVTGVDAAGLHRLGLAQAWRTPARLPPGVIPSVSSTRRPPD